MSFPQDGKEDFTHFLDDFKSRALVDAKTYDLFIGYLKHNRDPERPDAKSYKTYVLRCFYWDEEKGRVVFRSGNREVVTKDRIYDITTAKHVEADHIGAEGLYQRLNASYYGIPREAVRDLVRRCRKCFPRGSGGSLSREAGGFTPFRETPVFGGGGMDGHMEVDPSSRSDADSESLGTADHVENRLPWTAPEELRQWIEWLKHMKNRDWPPDLEYSRYRSTISGLCTILETAKPADAYVEQGDSAYSVPYDSADLLCLTMQQAIAKMDKTEGPAKPIFVKADITTVKGLRTIGSYLHFMQDWLFTTMAVEKPSRRCNQTSGARWPLGKVIQRFNEAGLELPPEEQPPITVLDLGSMESNVVPECFGAEAIRSLRRHKPGGSWRPVQELTSVEKWELLAQRGSGTMTHRDCSGFWTWVMVEEGEKLWMICRLSEDDRKRFAEEGSAFTGGQWFYVWLKPGDVLIMPPETVHAVFTPVDTLCIGGNARVHRHEDASTMRANLSVPLQPGATADGRSVARLEDLILKLSKQLASATSNDSAGTRGRRWAKSRNQTTSPTTRRQAITPATTAATKTTQPSASTSKKRTRSSMGPTPSAKRPSTNATPMRTRSLTSTATKTAALTAAKTPARESNTRPSRGGAKKSPSSPMTISTRRTTRLSRPSGTAGGKD